MSDRERESYLLVNNLLEDYADMNKGRYEDYIDNWLKVAKLVQIGLLHQNNDE